MVILNAFLHAIIIKAKILKIILLIMFLNEVNAQDCLK